MRVITERRSPLVFPVHALLDVDAAGVPQVHSQAYSSQQHHPFTPTSAAAYSWLTQDQRQQYSSAAAAANTAALPSMPPFGGASAGATTGLHPFQYPLHDKPQLLNAAVWLGFLVFKGPKGKLSSCC